MDSHLQEGDDGTDTSINKIYREFRTAVESAASYAQQRETNRQRATSENVTEELRALQTLYSGEVDRAAKGAWLLCCQPTGPDGVPLWEQKALAREISTLLTRTGMTGQSLEKIESWVDRVCGPELPSQPDPDTAWLPEDIQTEIAENERRWAAGEKVRAFVQPEGWIINDDDEEWMKTNYTTSVGAEIIRLKKRIPELLGKIEKMKAKIERRKPPMDEKRRLKRKLSKLELEFLQAPSDLEKWEKVQKQREIEREKTVKEENERMAQKESGRKKVF